MARWEEAYNAQLDVYKLYASPKGQQYAEAFAKSVFREMPYQDRPGSLFRNLGDRLATQAFNADPIYVDPDMMTVFEAAWKGFKPEPLAPTDLVTSHGFLLLPRSVRLTDVHGKETSYRAVMWEPVVTKQVHAKGEHIEHPGDEEPRQGIILTLLHDTNDMDDYTTPTDRKAGEFILSHTMPWQFGEDFHADIDEDDDAKLVVRPVQCLWRLMMQSLAVQSSAGVSRQARKRWEAAKLPVKTVTVVKLRRTYEDKDPGEPGAVAWTHRWLVRGFWRAQWYSSIQMHRQIWVSPYVKGSPDLPLVIKKVHAFEFVR